MPNLERLKCIPAREFGVDGPAIPIPGFEAIQLGGFNFARGEAELDLPILERIETDLKIEPHQTLDLVYTNFSTNTPPPLGIKIHDANGLVIVEAMKLNDGDGLILRETQVVMAKQKSKWGTRHYWDPAKPPSHNKDLTFNPHRNLKRGDKCPVCNC
jgi:hypothetical protein